MIKSKKTLGQVYTPNFIVNNILNLIEYKNKNLFKKYIIDNSCGDGAFLTEIVKRYCEYSKSTNLSNNELKQDLETYIYGIEINEKEYKKCISNLNNITEKYNIKNINWKNIICSNTLLISDKYYNKFDFVVGNPPYIRVHNLDKESYNCIKNYNFSQTGMTDIYIVFFEIGINMLNKNGILGYITPSSYFNSLSGSVLRNYLIDFNLLSKLINLKHFQCFDATTYTTITILDKNKKNNETKYYEYDEINKKEKFIDILNEKDFFIKNNFYFGNKENLKFLKHILNYNGKKYLEIKNGFATLCDNFFIKEKFEFNDYIIPIIKASTGAKYQCFFPYKNGYIVNYNDFDNNIKNYCNDYKTLLKNRDLEKKDIWWGFGRTQGISDVYKKKYSINSLLKKKDDIKLLECDEGVGIYSGLYILGNCSYENIKNILLTDDFINYISMLGKYKNGGYYTYSSKDLSIFLNYQLSKIYE